jgi:hypothetical protein
MRIRYIVTYDVSEKKRLRRVFKTCKNFGTHLQFSVFECDLTPTERIQMEEKLKEIIKAPPTNAPNSPLPPSASPTPHLTPPATLSERPRPIPAL